MTVHQHASATTLDEPAFVAEWERWHHGHEAQLADPHGFLAITGLHWLDESPARFPDAPGQWRVTQGRVEVTLGAEEYLTSDGVALSGTHLFETIPERGGVTLHSGDFVVEVAKRAGRHVVRPRHPDNALREDFGGTPTYPPSREWVVPGRYVAFDTPRATTVGSVVDGLEHVYDAPGRVEFELDGRPLALTVFPGHQPGTFNALFTDATSGVTTYGANRSLSIEAPEEDGDVVLDFNRAANLPCAYTDLATCPLPPTENRLPVAVEAGEQIPRERRA